MPVPPSPQQPSALGRAIAWFEKLMALLALFNLLLVLFDATFLTLRDLYLAQAAVLIRLYDPVKAIEPHRDTQIYLNTVDRLETELIQTGAQSPQVTSLLATLAEQSVNMIAENPFQIANKTGTLEKIKNRMRRYMNQESAKQSFRRFWSPSHFAQNHWTQELQFFNTEIRPLIATNYFRPTGETGELVDNFWRIDLIFITLFGVEFLGRTFYLSRRHRSPWLDTMLWRWYDLFLLLPFWRFLRVIPVLIRLHQVHWLNLQRVQALVNRNLAENIAGEVTELVVVRTIGLAQDSLEQGLIRRWLTQPPAKRVEINQINELEAIADRLLKLGVYRVLPQIQPDLEALLRHSIEAALTQTPFYQGLPKLPGLENLPRDIATQVAQRLSQTAYAGLTHSLEDAKGAAIASQLSQHLQQVLRTELQDKQTLAEIELLLADLLEELKLSFVQRAEAVDQTLAEVEALRHRTHAVSKLPPAKGGGFPPDPTSPLA